MNNTMDTNNEDIKLNGFLLQFIKEVEAVVGFVYYDEEYDLTEESLRIELEEYAGVVLYVDILLQHMSIYKGFSYVDIRNSEREKGVDVEEVERNIIELYSQKQFETSLKSLQIPVSVWDDNCWGCPCHETMVGLEDTACDINIIKKFISIVQGMECGLHISSLFEYRKTKLGQIFNEKLFSCGAEKIKIKHREDIDYVPLNTNNIVFYTGQDYVLLRDSNTVAAITRVQYELFLRILDEIEYFTDYKVELCGQYVRFTTATLIVDIFKQEFDSAFIIESKLLNLSLEKLLLFDNGSGQDLFINTLSTKHGQTINIDMITAPHIYTEGQTDAIHMANALAFFDKYSGQPWVFDEENKDQKKGDQELFKACEAYAKEKDPACVKIAIFDRDGSMELNKIEEENGFKYWGNRVYSLALPIPRHREKTPMISIEHYYSNEELAQEMIIDGISRRLFMGYEFDRLGRAPQLGMICKCINKCGPGKTGIIDSEVYDSNSTSMVNYALAKMNFANLIKERKEISTEAYAAYEKLFDKINDIIQHDKETTYRNK